MFALAAIQAALGGEIRLASGLEASEQIRISGIAPIASAGPGQITFAASASVARFLPNSKAACIILSPKLLETLPAHTSAIVVDDPYLYYAKLTQWWAQQTLPPTIAGIHPSAVVDASAQVDPSASIGPHCVLEAGARVGAHTVLKARVYLGRDCTIGAHCVLHVGVVVGDDGFGFANTAGANRYTGTWEKIAQLGAVRIGNAVDIGSNTCIDRGAIEDTVIEDGVIIDNLTQIGHNVHIGPHTVVGGLVGIAGSAKIGAHCAIGGAARIMGHCTLADHVVISADTFVTRSIASAGQYTGVMPMDEHGQWEKNSAALRRLYALRERVRTLERLVPVQDKPPSSF